MTSGNRGYPAADDAAAEPSTNGFYVGAVDAAIPPGTPPPKVSVEVWAGEDQIDASVADVVRINDTWHVVVTVDGT